MRNVVLKPIYSLPLACALSLVSACSDQAAAASAALTSYAAGAPAEPAAAGCAAPPPTTVKPPCLKRDSQLIVIGDSYFNWFVHDFPNDLQRALGHGYRMYAEPGASMASGGIATPVPDQLDTALAEDRDVIAAIMTGGGNDILLPDTFQYPGSDECKERADSPSLQVCQEVVAAAVSKAEMLIQTAVGAGIKDVIYVFYPQIPGNLLGIYATHPNEILGYSSPMARQVCDQASAKTNGALRCHFLDLQPLFAGHPELFADDGIHENERGSALIASEAVKIMKDSCIAQPAASGCCTP